MNREKPSVGVWSKWSVNVGYVKPRRMDATNQMTENFSAGQNPPGLPGRVDAGAHMKFAVLSGWLIFFLILGFTARLALAQEKMRVAIPLFPTAAFPVLVANDRGFFQKEGLTVEPIRINSAPTTYQALISGDVHMAAGAPTGLLPSHAQGAARQLGQPRALRLGNAG